MAYRHQVRVGDAWFVAYAGGISRWKSPMIVRVTATHDDNTQNDEYVRDYTGICRIRLIMDAVGEDGDSDKCVQYIRCDDLTQKVRGPNG